MGKQIAVALTFEDEARLLDFLHVTAAIQIYRSWSPTPEPVQLLSTDLEASPFFIHNKAFSWEPEFERLEIIEKSTGQPRVYYRLKNDHGPVLEYSRHALEAKHPQVAGRLYWANSFKSTPTYDTVAFSAWYNRVSSWLRRQGTRVRHGSTEPYCLTGARSLLANEACPAAPSGAGC